MKKIIKLLGLERKLELTEETITLNGEKLSRIRSLKTFGAVTEGDIGGFVEDKRQISRKGKCFVFDNARLRERSRIEDDAQLRGNAEMSGYSFLGGSVLMFGNAFMTGCSCAYDKSRIGGTAIISEFARIEDSAVVTGSAEIKGNARICDWAVISGTAVVDGRAVIGQDALVYSNLDFICIDDFGEIGKTATFFRTRGNGIGACFDGMRCSIYLLEYALQQGLTKQEYEDTYGKTIRKVRTYLKTGEFK